METTSCATPITTNANALRLVEQPGVDDAATPRFRRDLHRFHRTILELERRVLRELTRHLDSGGSDRVLHATSHPGTLALDGSGER